MTRRDAATYAAGITLRRTSDWRKQAEESFDDFWKTYLRYHAQEGTRLLHVAGTGIGATALVLGLLTINPADRARRHRARLSLRLDRAFPHREEPPRHGLAPAWAFQCDIRMFRLWLTGQLGPELKRAGVA